MTHRPTAALAALAATLCLTAADVHPARAAAPPAVSSGHSDWAWGNPRPQGQDLDAVAFSESTGYAAGVFGTVLRSTDGGRSWTGLPSGAVDDLTALQVPDARTVIVGGGCSAAISTDAGAHFSALPVPGAPGDCPDPVAALSFTDAQHGLVALRDGTVLSTVDGGRSLRRLGTVPLTPDQVGARRLTGILFTSPSVGVAITSAGMIERTTDGGLSWTLAGGEPARSSGTPVGLSAITAAGPGTEYAVGPAATMLASTDGGASWTPRPLRLPAGSRSADLSSIDCSSATRCVMGASASRVVATADGGATATVTTVPGQGVGHVALTDGGAVGVGDFGATVISTDGGASYAPAPGSRRFAFHADGPLVAGGAPGTMYVGGDHGTLVTATGGGRAWSLRHVPTTHSVIKVAFPTARTGYTLDGSGTLRRTTDGGAGWRTIGHHADNTTLLSPSARVQLFVGPTGIVRSTHAGTGFAPTGGAAIARRRFAGATADGDEVLAWGPGGIVRSLDAGGHWRGVASPYRGAIVSGMAAVGERLWALTGPGVRGRLFASADGGRRWTEQTSVGALASLAGVSFADARHGLLGVRATQGLGGHSSSADVGVLSTSDGGRTWQPQLVEEPDDGDPPAAEVLARPGTDFYYDVDQPGAFLFRDGRGGDAAPGAVVPPAPTRLTISVPRRVTAGALRRSGGTLTVRGRVDPVPSDGGTVVVSTRRVSPLRGRLPCHPAPSAVVCAGDRLQAGVQRVRAGSDGRFSVRVALHASSVVVAQAIGDGTSASAGTPAAVVDVVR